MLGYVSEQVKKNCWNLYDSYGEICVHCGCCAKDRATRYKARINALERRIKERENFDLWSDDPGLRAIQEKNHASTIASWKKELEKYRKLLLVEEHRDQWNEELKQRLRQEATQWARRSSDETR